MEQLRALISLSNEYQMVRYPNPLIFHRHTIPILQFLNPSRLAKVKLNKGVSKIIENGGSVANQYLRFTGMEKEKEILSKIKKRFCHTSNEDVSLIPNTRQRNLTKKRIVPIDENKQKPTKVYDNYQEVLVFKTDDIFLLRTLCHYLWLHNINESHEVMMVFFPKLIHKVAAALQI
jgi:hypothetical protein